MKCADCTSAAVWIFDDPGALPVPYCDDHLPTWLRKRAVDGSITKAPVAEENAPKKPVKATVPDVTPTETPAE